MQISNIQPMPGTHDISNYGSFNTPGAQGFLPVVFDVRLLDS